MKILKYNEKNFFNNLKKHINKRDYDNTQVIDKQVKKILNEVKLNGDSALLKYSKKFDNIKLKSKDLRLSNKIRKSYKNKIKQNVFNSFLKAINNVKRFHKYQYPNNNLLAQNGTKLKTRWKALDSVGLYIPGGQGAYPSSVIMNVVPAKIAGVKRIVCVMPPSKNFNPYVLALLDKLGIEEIYQVGGAQAIAALTYGTKTIKPVNKIFGPGNDFVASAKKQVFGKVGIDLIAGPSEIVVVANEKNNPEWVASDLMAQSEHDINAQSILISNNKYFIKSVIDKITKLNKNMLKKNIINKSLQLNGLGIFVEDIYKSNEIINFIGPEHLHLHVKTSDKFLNTINNAGCIFVGEYSSEAFGDYIIGTNHILPTFGSAKFSSGLGVIDFMKRNTIVEMNQSSYLKYKNDVKRMAEIENLYAHKLSVKIRQNK
tara:strand:- start:51 stop:1337 length:1287 start_codon:yes stop_codon:yes gene_type:complete